MYINVPPLLWLRQTGLMFKMQCSTVVTMLQVQFTIRTVSSKEHSSSQLCFGYIVLRIFAHQQEIEKKRKFFAGSLSDLRLLSRSLPLAVGDLLLLRHTQVYCLRQKVFVEKEHDDFRWISRYENISGAPLSIQKVRPITWFLFPPPFFHFSLLLLFVTLISCKLSRHLLSYPIFPYDFSNLMVYS